VILVEVIQRGSAVFLRDRWKNLRDVKSLKTPMLLMRGIILTANILMCSVDRMMYDTSSERSIQGQFKETIILVAY